MTKIGGGIGRRTGYTQWTGTGSGKRKPKLVRIQQAVYAGCKSLPDFNLLIKRFNLLI